MSGERQVTTADDVHRRRLQALLPALGELAGEETPRRRLRQLVRLSVDVVDADHAVLAFRDDPDAPVDVFASTDDAGQRRAAEAVLEDYRPGGGWRAVPQQDEGTSPVLAWVQDGRPLLRVRVSNGRGHVGELYLLRRPDERPFDADDQALIREFVKMAALALENAIHLQESQQRLQWLRASATVSRVLLNATGADETQVWQSIADHVRRLARARTVTIGTADEDDPERLQVRVAAGVGAAELPGFTYPRAGSMSDHAMTTMRGVVGTADRWRVSHSQVAPEDPIGPLLAMPLIGGGSPRGVIVLSRRAHERGFSAADRSMAQDFANQATLAIELAEARGDQLRLQARTEVQHVADTYQDRVIQRLYAVALTLEAAARDTPSPWIDRARSDIDAAMAEARQSLADEYGMTSPG